MGGAERRERRERKREHKKEKRRRMWEDLERYEKEDEYGDEEKTSVERTA